ncbi:uncharacterized protein METZ01_LOCUS443076, partial [marine metagenome]
VATSRQDFSAGKLPEERVAALEAIPGWVWNALEAAFQDGLGVLAQFVAREGHASVPRRHVELFQGAEFKLRRWVQHRRNEFRAGRLPEERVAALEALPGWVWDPFEAAFQVGLGVLAQFVAREGHARVPASHVESFQGAEFKLGIWASNHRNGFKTGMLSAERIASLEAVPGWVWDKVEAAFQDGLGALAQFVEREGHARVPTAHVESFQGAEFSLGSWVGTNRGEFNAGRLPAERVTALEAIPGWVWDAPEEAFRRGLG